MQPSMLDHRTRPSSLCGCVICVHSARPQVMSKGWAQSRDGCGFLAPWLHGEWGHLQRYGSTGTGSLETLKKGMNCRACPMLCCFQSAGPKVFFVIQGQGLHMHVITLSAWVTCHRPLTDIAYGWLTSWHVLGKGSKQIDRKTCWNACSFPSTPAAPTPPQYSGVCVGLFNLWDHLKGKRK